MGERVSEDDRPAHRCTGSGHLSGKSEHPSGQSGCPRKCEGSQLSRALAGPLGAARNQGSISPHLCWTAQGACPAPQLHTGLTASALISWPARPLLQTDRQMDSALGAIHTGNPRPPASHLPRGKTAVQCGLGHGCEVCGHLALHSPDARPSLLASDCILPRPSR